ncbi:MAG: hypothetical protein Q4C53_01995 [Clostridia bacterium]|nr:hypothetical protein [Clostridia bacterium]
MENKPNEELRLVVKTDRPSAFAELGILYVALYVVMSLLNSLIVGRFDVKFFLLMFLLIVLLLLYAVKSAECTITFVAADEFRGARAFIEMGRKRMELSGVSAEEFIIKQLPFEKKRNTGLIRVKKYRMFLFGISGIEEVRAFLDKHFRRSVKKKKK